MGEREDSTPKIGRESCAGPIPAASMDPVLSRSRGSARLVVDWYWRADLGGVGEHSGNKRPDSAPFGHAARRSERVNRAASRHQPAPSTIPRRTPWRFKSSHPHSADSQGFAADRRPVGRVQSTNAR
jgi:hypothetical protein